MNKIHTQETPTQSQPQPITIPVGAASPTSSSQSEKQGVTGMSAHVKILQDIIVGVMVVVGLSFVLLVIQYFTASQTAFLNLSNQVTAQNEDIKLLLQLEQNSNYETRMIQSKSGTQQRE